MQINFPTTDEIRGIIRDEVTAILSTFQQTKTETDHIGGIELAVEITKLAKATIYSLVSQRKIPHLKQGKQLYFSKFELLNWLRSGRRKTTAEIAAEAENFTPKTKRRKSIITR
jgi:hypothetical protein